MTLSSENFRFLKELENNNNRDWFNTHKAEYQAAYENTVDFADELLKKLNQHDLIETPTGKKSLFRIYRDTRFSADKTPYKTHWAGGFKRASAHRRGGYYFHIQPGDNSFVAGGFWAPNKEDLLRIREEMASEPEEIRTILSHPYIAEAFGGLQGDQLKTAPKGFAKDHPAIDLLRYNQFILARNFKDTEVLAPDFADRVDDTFQRLRPFFDYMSDVLTTDANGTPL